MHPIAAVAGYFAFIFIGGALIAPWLYQLISAAAGSIPLFQPLAHHPFHRFVDRSFLVLGILGLWPFMKSIGVSSWSALGWGGTSRQAGARLATAGFAAGFASLLCAAVLSWSMGARTWNVEAAPGAIVRHLLNATLAAVVVAILEESFFRGAVFGALRRCGSPAVALLASSGIYAIVHFFQRPPAPESVNWSSGLVTLAEMSRGFVDLPRLIPGFFSLLIAGAILALGYRRTGSLFFSAGLHAGWIFWLKSYGFLTRPQPGANEWLWGGARLIDGWGALVVLTAVWFGAHRWLRERGTAAIPERGKVPIQP
jgi:hypothetical protein